MCVNANTKPLGYRSSLRAGVALSWDQCLAWGLLTQLLGQEIHLLFSSSFIIFLVSAPCPVPDWVTLCPFLGSMPIPS